MYVLNLDTREKIEKFDKYFYNTKDSYVMLSTPNELKLLKNILNIDEITFKDCLTFDENIKLDLFDDYDFLSVNTFNLDGNDSMIEEINIYTSDNYILVVSQEEHYIYCFVKTLILNNIKLDDTPPIVSLFKINYLIFKNIIVHEFENLEQIEDMILEIEDAMMDGKKDDYITQINYVRSITRSVVKNTRPLLYIGDRIIKENIRYLKYSDVKKYNLENLQGLDFGIDKLYAFALSTRELADKLLDIHSSQVAEKTNNLITKLTILTAIAAPLTIITGIYGMNFKYMPELELLYGYPLILGIMVCIIVIGILIFKFNKLL
ncbi:CorA family divalent cation transporter [Clostridium sp. CCUG 7971]|uniref:CorA family divalent cation transporter n=1 Tax=Clostridium sp. CCUG 7971 TaxID=2811414 RepID=UPI001ABA22B9|nr:CorA family divalent cation transporter [Clostridium sp. CCUG 7971]MBO3445564.1 cation transporter [Clostridium sp. CCUG 7971]